MSKRNGPRLDSKIAVLIFILFFFSVSLLGSQPVALRWDPPGGTDVAGYRVYRSEAPGEGFLPIATNSSGSTSYTDFDVEVGRVYYYAVTAFTSSGSESPLSEVITVSVENTQQPVVAEPILLFRDRFQRADSDNVGRQWAEIESSSRTIIRQEKLVFDALDDELRPMISHGFASQKTGVVTLEFELNFRRQSEKYYSFWMQLGKQNRMSSDDPISSGVAANLTWGGPGDGLDSHEGLGYLANGRVTQVAVVSGPAAIGVTVDLDRRTYGIRVDGRTVAKEISYQDIGSIDTVRFFANGLNSINFFSSEIDDVSIFLGQVPQSQFTPPLAVNRDSDPGEDSEAGLFPVAPASIDTLAPVLNGLSVTIAAQNSRSEPVQLRLESVDADGHPSHCPVLPPMGAREQKVFEASNFQVLREEDAWIMGASSHPQLDTLFLLSDSALERFDVFGGKLEPESQAYFPYVRDNDVEQTILFMFNGDNDNSGSLRLRLMDRAGALKAEVEYTLPPLGSLRGNIEEIFGRVVGADGGYVEMLGEPPMIGIELLATSREIALLPAQAASESGKLYLPHFFLDEGGETEVTLLSSGQERLRVQISARDDRSNLIGTVETLLEPRQVYTASVAEMLDWKLGDATISGYLEVEILEGSVSGEDSLIGVARFKGRESGFLAASPLRTRAGTTEEVFLHVTQSLELGRFTGLAILNPGTETAQIRVEGFDEGGMQTAETEFDLAPGMRVADVLNGSAFFGAGFEQVNGHFRISSTRPVISLVLVGDYLHKFLSAVDGQRVEQ